MSKETIQQLIERHVIDNNGQWNHETDEAWILAGQGQFKITRQEFNAAADRMRGKPDWSELPAKAEWLAQDRCGTWKPMQGRKPDIECDSYWLTDRHLQPQMRGTVIGDWRNTLEKRPEQASSLEAKRFGIMPPVNKNEGCNISAPTKHWFEDGELPPVGTECEVFNHEFHGNAAWEKCTILFMGKFKCIYSSESCHERVGNVDLTGAIEFRPIKTDKEKAIEAARVLLEKVVEGESFLNTLYDAGLLRLPDQK